MKRNGSKEHIYHFYKYRKWTTRKYWYGDELREVVVIQNPYNDIAYVLDSNIYKSPFFEYVLNNLKPQSKIKY